MLSVLKKQNLLYCNIFGQMLYITQCKFLLDVLREQLRNSISAHDWKLKRMFRACFEKEMVCFDPSPTDSLKV